MTWSHCRERQEKGGAGKGVRLICHAQRDTLDAGLAAADSEWGTTMSAAGSKLGAGLDGIQDFDWQHVRDYVGSVTTARQTAEIGALTAQVGFVTSYYSSLNSYTASIASASVTHATSYAQSTADYYVTTADHTAAAAEADLAAAIAGGASAGEVATLTATATAKRAKANAFATFSTSYVSYLTTEAQTAATTAVSGVTIANATALSDITTEVATATTDINTFYTQQAANAQSPPTINPVADHDGLPDPVAPTATETITGNINAAKTAYTTSRTAVHGSFADEIARRTTSTTNSYTIQNTGGSGQSGTTGGNSGNMSSTQQAPGTSTTTSAQTTPAPANPTAVTQNQNPQVINSETGIESPELALGPGGAVGVHNNVIPAIVPPVLAQNPAPQVQSPKVVPPAAPPNPASIAPKSTRPTMTTVGKLGKDSPADAYNANTSTASMKYRADRIKEYGSGSIGITGKSMKKLGGGTIGTGQGTGEYYSGLLPGEIAGTGECKPCVGVIILSPDGQVLVFHFDANSDATTALQVLVIPAGSKVLIIAGVTPCPQNSSTINTTAHFTEMSECRMTVGW